MKEYRSSDIAKWRRLHPKSVPRQFHQGRLLALRYRHVPRHKRGWSTTEELIWASDDWDSLTEKEKAARKVSNELIRDLGLERVT